MRSLTLSEILQMTMVLLGFVTVLQGPYVRQCLRQLFAGDMQKPSFFEAIQLLVTIVGTVIAFRTVYVHGMMPMM